MKKEFKVEIYVHAKEDIQEIIDAVNEKFAGRKRADALPGEFGKIRVEHHHYQLDVV